MASWVPAAQDRPVPGIKTHEDHRSAEQHVALIEGCEGCSEQELRTRLSSYGPIAWCRSIDNGNCLARYTSSEGLAAAICALNGSIWKGRAIRVSQYSVGSSLVPPLHVDSPFGRSESIPAMQLDYLEMLFAEEQTNQQQQAQQQALLGQQSSNFQGAFPELEPCHPEWNPVGSSELLTPLEDEVLSMDDSPMHSFTHGSSPSTSQLWTQRSIGTVARKDLAKFAALQSMVHQHSNSSSPGPGLGPHSSLGLASSPWGSFTCGSSGAEAASADSGLAGLVRRVSSPTGNTTLLTPRSNCSFVAAPDTTSLQNQQLLQICTGLTNGSKWPNQILQLPTDLGLGDTCTEEPASSMLRVAAQQGGQQLLQSNMNADPMTASLGGVVGAAYAAGELVGRGMNSNADHCSLLATAIPAPPPPPPAQQQQLLGVAPPPPPPRNGDGCIAGYAGSDGRLSGTASPVPAPPPPRAITPGGTAGSGQVWAPSPGSPRFAGASQPQSPSRPPRAATRLFQPSMSNLGHQPQGLHPQHSYDGNYLGTQQQPALPTGAFNQLPMQCQQQHQYRVNSPVNRVPPLVPPPPPPGMPGYAAASAAAAANGICGSPIPPASPGGACGPLPGMLSCPNGMLEAMVRGAGGVPGTPNHAQGGHCTAAPDRPVSSNMALTPTAPAATPVYKVDGAMFVQELLQLLQNGAAAGNTFLANLMDLLECALASSVVTPTLAAAVDVNAIQETVAGSTEGSAPGYSTEDDDDGDAAVVSRAAPVDAAAFLGMLQEAAAPLVAAAVTGATRTSMMGLQPKRGTQRTSESTNGSTCNGSSMSGSPAVGIKQASDAVGELGKGLRPIKTDRNSMGGGDHACSDLDTPPGMLLRHQLSSRAGGSAPGSPLLYPLHPRTTTHGGGPNSCGGAAAGTPHGTPMLLVPQTLPELLSARAALMRLMTSAQGFLQSPAYAYMASKLDGVEGIYDSMHDDPVVVKRRKCKEMAAMRDVIRVDQAFSQAVSSLSSLRNHIYSLSRKVLIGYGHVEGLPVDLLLGGLTSELAAILKDPLGQPAPGVTGSQVNGSSGGAEQQAGSSNEHGSLPQPVMEFFSTKLPVPKLALLVFTEFVPVDPSPCCMTPAPGTPAAVAAISGSSNGGAVESLVGVSSAGSSASNGGSAGLNGSSSNVGGNGSYAQQRGSNLSRHVRRGSNSSAEGAATGVDGAREASGPGHHHGGRSSNNRYSRDGDKAESNANSNGNQVLHRSRCGSFNNRTDNSNNSIGNGGKGSGSENGGSDSGSGGSSWQQQRSNPRRRESQQCEFDLVAEAAALEAAASAAAPLVAAAVCDLPSGARKRGSNCGLSLSWTYAQDG